MNSEGFTKLNGSVFAFIIQIKQTLSIFFEFYIHSFYVIFSAVHSDWQWSTKFEQGTGL